MSISNPLGYGHPLVGLFTSNSNLIAYGGLIDSHTSEQGFIINSCEINDDEEEGITSTISIDLNKVGLSDSSFFHHGNKIVVRIGYLHEEQIFWGNPYHLIVLNKRIQYKEIINLTLELVDEKIYSSKIGAAQGEDDILKRTRDEILKSEEIEIDIKELEDHIIQTDFANIEDIIIELNRIRINIFERSGYYIYTFRGENYETINDLRERARNSRERSRGRTRDQWGELLRMSDWDIFKNYARLRSGTPRGDRFGRFYVVPGGEYKSHLIDLYGFSIGKRGTDEMGNEYDRGQYEWVDFLEQQGIFERIKEHYGRYQALLFDQSGNFSPEQIDAFMQLLVDEWVLKRVQADLNKSGIQNLETYLRTKLGGPHILTDKGEGDGLEIKTRDLDAPAYMVLTYKGGSGDLLNVSIETNYEEPEFVTDEATDIDPETGNEVSYSTLQYNSTDGVKPGGAGQFVTHAINAVIEGRELPKMSQFNQYIELTPFHVMDTGTPSELKPEGFFTAAIDRTRVVKNIPPSRVLHKPLSITEVLNELDNRRGDINLKRIIANPEILGNPNLRSGQVFILTGVAKRFTGRYYALVANHSITISNGYIVKLEMGKIPEKAKGIILEKKEEEEVTSETRSWKYIKSGRVVEVDSEGNLTGAFHETHMVTDEGHPGEMKFYIKNTPAWFDHERGMIYPSGFDPDFFEQSIRDFQKQQQESMEGFEDIIGEDPTKPEVRDRIRREELERYIDRHSFRHRVSRKLFENEFIKKWFE